MMGHEHRWALTTAGHRVCPAKGCRKMQRQVDGEWVDVQPPKVPPTRCEIRYDDTRKGGHA